MERLLDKYHFQENSISFDHGLEEAGFTFVNGHIEEKFGKIPFEVVSKVLCTILRSIRRHTNGKSEYLDFTRQFFGL